MADAKTDLARAGTMQVTAKEGIAFLKDAGKDTLLEMQGLKDDDASTSKPSVPRDTTMAATAKEGREFVERMGDKTLSQYGSQWAENSESKNDDENMSEETEPAKSSLPRDSTMAVTAKEADVILGDSRPDPDAHTRGQQKKLEDVSKEEPPAKKVRLAKGTTMVATAKEARGLLGGDAPDEDAMTRGQQKKLAEIQSEKPAAPSPKKPKMAKGTTMIGTAKEAKAILGGDAPDSDAMTRSQQKQIEAIQAEKPSPKKLKMAKAGTMVETAKEGKALLQNETLGDTRQVTKAKRGRPSGPKRTSTIQKTMEEAVYVTGTDKVDVGEGRRTRSAGKPKPALKKAGTMQATAKEGKEFLKRGRKPKKAAEEEEDEGDSDVE